MQRPRVDPQENMVTEGEPARFRCWLPGDPTAILTWKMKGGDPLPSGVQQQNGLLNIPSAHRQHIGSYICTASDPNGYKPPLDSPVARLIVRPGKYFQNIKNYHHIINSNSKFQINFD